MADRFDAEAVFLEHLPWIEEVAAMVCRRNSVWGDDADDFRASALVKLMENDYAAIRKFRGETGMKTYLARVVVLHFMERARERAGRWRPSAAAEGHGQLAKDLEAMVYRDGCSLAEAAERLRTAGRTTATDAELARLLALLPMRHPMRPVEAGAETLKQHADGLQSDHMMEAAEDGAARARVLAALSDAIGQLPPEDKLLARMHLADGSTVADVARALRLDQKALYRRLPQLKRMLREHLELAGVTAALVRETLYHSSLEADVKVPKGVQAEVASVLAGLRLEHEKAINASVRAGSAGSTPAEPAQDVLISISAPTTAPPASLFVARFAAYTPEIQESTLKLLGKLAGGDEIYENVRESRWAHNTRVTVRLIARGLKVDAAEQSFDWRGTRTLLDFTVEVPAEAAFKQTVLRFEVIVAGFDVAPVALPLAIGEGMEERETSTVEPARTAFASYAHHDKQRVLDRVAAVRIAAGLDVFLDCLSLRPNEKWKPELERRIIDSDLFLLFWSKAAKDSPWVTWEWKTAWEKKPRDRFQIHPLQYALPPPELAELQMDDVLMTLRDTPDAGA